MDWIEGDCEGIMGAIAMPARRSQAWTGGGRWKSAESRGAAGARPREFADSDWEPSGDTSPMNSTGNIAISRPETPLRKLEPAWRCEAALANRKGAESEAEFWL